MNPFLKWAGGKTQLSKKILSKIDNLIIKDNYRFYEPFVGGGSIFLALANPRTTINDLNTELINVYLTIRDNPGELMVDLDKKKIEFEKDKENYYYDIRNYDRQPELFSNLSNVSKASRTIFLNKTCYNGLYRVNSLGQFNTPIGKPTNVNFYSKNNIIKISKFLNLKQIRVLNGDYYKSLRNVRNGDIIYFDPPYHYENGNGFTSYQKEGFSFKDFVNLKKRADRYVGRGASIIISNNETTKVLELFDKDPSNGVYIIEKVQTLRMINSDSTMRRKGDELLIVGIPANDIKTDKFNLIYNYVQDPKDILWDCLKTKKQYKISSDKEYFNLLATLRFLSIIDEHKKITEIGTNISDVDYNGFLLKIYKLLYEKTYYKNILDTARKLETKDLDEILNYLKKVKGIKLSILNKNLIEKILIHDLCLRGN